MSDEAAERMPAPSTTDRVVEAAMRRLRNPRLYGVTEGQAVAELIRIGAPALPVLVESLRGHNRRVQRRAACVLRQCNLPAGRDALREYISASFARLPRRRLGKQAKSLAQWPLVGFWLTILAQHVSHEVADVVLITVIGYALVTNMLAALLFDRTQEIRKEAVAAIAEAQDLHDIHLLVRCLQDEEAAIRSEAATALPQMLNRLRASDAGLLSDEAMAALIRELSRRDTGVILAILGALEQVGDERALPAVERLAAGHGAGRDAKVRRAAEVCLPALRERVDRSQSAHGLLRPAEASEEPASALLRPASGTETAAEALVRPSGGRE